jgi:hypothetical protein
MVLSLFSVFVIAHPFLVGPDEGTLTVRWSSPTGLVLRNLVKGDSIEVSYESDLPLSLYLLDLKDAEDFRRPSFYKGDLPVPLRTGTSADIKVRVDGTGDMEILFWNASFTTDQTVDYSIRVHRRALTWGMVVSGSGLLILCLSGAVFLIRKGRDDRTVDRPPSDR